MYFRKRIEDDQKDYQPLLLEKSKEMKDYVDRKHNNTEKSRILSIEKI